MGFLNYFEPAKIEFVFYNSKSNKFLILSPDKFLLVNYYSKADETLYCTKQKILKISRLCEYENSGILYLGQL